MLISSLFLKGARSSDRNNNASYTEKCQAHILYSFAYKVARVMMNLLNQLFFTEKKMQFIDSLKQFKIKKGVWLLQRSDKKAIRWDEDEEKMKKSSSQVTYTGYVINHLMSGIIK